MTHPDPSWYASLALRQSAGQRTAKARSLADLHRRRAEHGGQFFTPTEVAQFMWDLGLSAFGPSAEHGLSVFDNAIGSGRLIQFARTEDRVYGCDVDAPLVASLRDALADGGIRHQLEAAPMQAVRAKGMDLALINPPFSLHLESPLLSDYPCCTYGRFGPSTSAMSHWYALYQACAAARVVVALLPTSVVDQMGEHPELLQRLHCIVDLPRSTFADEQAEVLTSVLAFGDMTSQVGGGECALRVAGLDTARSSFDRLAASFEPLHLSPGQESGRAPQLRVKGQRQDQPVITGPVTGDKRVRLYRSGRQVKLGFSCALVEAQVRNAILEAPLGSENHLRNRYPKGISYVGSARLLVDVLLCATRPLEKLDALCALISSAGGAPQPCPQLVGYLRRRWREVQVERVPLQRTIFDPDGGAGTGDLDGVRVEVLKHHLAEPGQFSSPLARKGAKVTLVRAADAADPRYRYDLAPGMPALSVDELRERVRLPSAGGAGAWRQIERGRAAAFPQRAAALDRRLTQAGADGWLGSWKFQRSDVIELCMTRGATGGHMMGLGKSRIAAGCCLLGGRHNAIVVEAALVPEMARQLRLLGLPAGDVKIVRSARDVTRLRRINLISYHTLRRPLAPGSRRMLASLLRRRFHTVCADEGSLVAHTHSQQTRALYQLSPKRRIALDGTPIPNLPRNLLPLVCWTSREGTASQPYGMRSPYITGELFQSAYPAERGIDRFREEFVVTEFVTHTFCDDLQTGGKREIPSLRNIDRYRDFVGRHVLRRVWGEPDVAVHVPTPHAQREVVEVEWDDDHLEFFITIAKEFAEWWKRQRASTDPRKLNMTSVLMRIAAAGRATSIPQDLKCKHPWRGGLTSKQRWCIDLLRDLDADGARTLCFFESPLAAQIVAANLRREGTDVLTYTGLETITARTRRLEEEFLSGKARTLLMTFGCGARGLNLPEASHTVFYDRMWSPRQEEQALFRALRANRVGTLKAIYGELTGSLDTYKAQMVAFKQDTCRVGLDFGTPEFRPQDFKHWLGIIDEFCESIGRSRIELARRDRAAA